MTEKSQFWTHGAGGDAAYSPYDNNEFGPSFLDRIFPAFSGGIVIPLYANNLEVTASSPAAKTVTVKSGAAFLSGFFYESSGDEVLTVASNASGFPRLDRIVLRVDWAARTIRLAVLEGEATDEPELPTLTQLVGDIWEESLAYVWVENGFTALDSTDIHDERMFRVTAELLQSHHTTHNLLYNPEFLAWSGYNDGSVISAETSSVTRAFRAALRYKPDYWYETGEIKRSYVTTDQQVFHPGWLREDHPSEMVSRGFVVNFTPDLDSSGIRQRGMIREGLTYSLKVLVFVPAGSEAVIGYAQNGTNRETAFKYIKRTGEWIAETIRFTGESGATGVEVYLLSRYADQPVKYAQVILVPSYIPGEFREHHQIIPFDTYVGTEAGYLHDRVRYNETETDVLAHQQDIYTSRGLSYSLSPSAASDPGTDRLISGTMAAGTSSQKQINGSNAYEGGQVNKIPDRIKGFWIAADVSSSLVNIIGSRTTAIEVSTLTGRNLFYGASTAVGVPGRINNAGDFYIFLRNDASIGYDPVHIMTFAQPSAYVHTASQFFSLRPVVLET